MSSVPTSAPRPRCAPRPGMPGRFRSLVVGSGGAAVPLQLGGVLDSWVEAPDLDQFRHGDPRAIVAGALTGASDAMRCLMRSARTTSPVMRATGSSNRCATRAATPPSCPSCDLPPQIRTPVQIIAGTRDTAVPPVNAQFLHDRLPHSTPDLIAPAISPARRHRRVRGARHPLVAGGYAAAARSPNSAKAEDLTNMHAPTARMGTCQVPCTAPRHQDTAAPERVCSHHAAPAPAGAPEPGCMAGTMSARCSIG